MPETNAAVIEPQNNLKPVPKDSPVNVGPENVIVIDKSLGSAIGEAAGNAAAIGVQTATEEKPLGRVLLRKSAETATVVGTAAATGAVLYAIGRPLWFLFYGPAAAEELE